MDRKILRYIIVAVLLSAFFFSLSACGESEQESNNPIVAITLESGEHIKLELYPDIAPKTVENFLKYVNDGFYNGTIFHRVINNYMIQSGGYFAKKDDIYYKQPTYEPIIGEFTENGVTNNLLHEPGVISMARTGDPNSATSQFFICTEMSEEQANIVNGSYAAFGRVTDTASLDVVRRISKVQTGYYNDDIYGTFESFPTETVRIETIVQTK